MKTRIVSILSILATIGIFNVVYKKLQYSMMNSILIAVLAAIILTVIIDSFILKKK